MENVVAGEILQMVQEQLASYGLAFTHDVLTTHPGMWKGTMQFGDSHAFVRVVLVAPMTLTALAHVGVGRQQLLSPRLQTLVVGRHVHEKSANAFRELGIAYADTVGNAYIRYDNVLIDVRGRHAPPPQPDRRSDPRDHNAPRPSSSNLFSTGRAQVIATLLAWPDLADEPVREIARAAGVSTGQAHSTLTLLEQTGYLAGRRLRADRIDDLLDMWTAAYPRGLGRKLALASYASVNDIRDFRREVLASPVAGAGSDLFVLSGESIPGLGLKRPRSVTVYTPDWHPRRAIHHRWRAARTTAEADIHVRQQFWTPPTDGSSAAHDPIAPWPVVYADLMAAGDERLAAVAVEWRDHHRTA